MDTPKTTRAPVVLKVLFRTGRRRSGMHDCIMCCNLCRLQNKGRVRVPKQFSENFQRGGEWGSFSIQKFMLQI